MADANFAQSWAVSLSFRLSSRSSASELTLDQREGALFVGFGLHCHLSFPVEFQRMGPSAPLPNTT